MSQDAYPFILRLGVPLNALCKPSKNNEQDKVPKQIKMYLQLKYLQAIYIFTQFFYTYIINIEK